MGKQKGKLDFLLWLANQWYQFLNSNLSHCTKNKACVTWYATERGKGKIDSSTLCVWTNKPQGQTAKAVRMKIKQKLTALHDL